MDFLIFSSITLNFLGFSTIIQDRKKISGEGKSRYSGTHSLELGFTWLYWYLLQYCSTYKERNRYFCQRVRFGPNPHLNYCSWRFKEFISDSTRSNSSSNSFCCFLIFLFWQNIFLFWQKIMTFFSYRACRAATLPGPFGFSRRSFFSIFCFLAFKLWKDRNVAVFLWTKIPEVILALQVVYRGKCCKNYLVRFDSKAWNCLTRFAKREAALFT